MDVTIQEGYYFNGECHPLHEVLLDTVRITSSENKASVL